MISLKVLIFNDAWKIGTLKRFEIYYRYNFITFRIIVSDTLLLDFDVYAKTSFATGEYPYLKLSISSDSGSTFKDYLFK